MRRITFLIICIIVIVIVFYIVNFKHVERTNQNDVSIKIDSVFINHYKDKKTDDIMYVFVYVSIDNQSNDTLKIKTRWGDFERKDADINNMYGIYKKQKFNFFSGTYSHNLSIIAPGECKSGDFELGDNSKFLMWQEEYYKEFERKVDFMTDIVNKSTFYFELGGKMYEIPAGKRIIQYRDAEDKGEHTWK